MSLSAITDAPDALHDAQTVAVLLHGYGSNERDLVALAQTLPTEIPWVSLRAPLHLGGDGYAWFPITEPGNPGPAPLAEATAAIWAWVSTTLPDTTKIVPIGFSQGGLMASQLLRTMPDRIVAPVLLGGFVAGGTEAGDANLAEQRPAVFCGRGLDDRVIQDTAVERTTAWLAAHTTATERTYAGLGHSINAEELADVQHFLAEQLSS